LKFTIIDDAEEVQRIFVGYKYIERREEKKKKKKKSRFIRPKILSSPLLVLLVLVLVLL
jgi:cell division protein FtsB